MKRLVDRKQDGSIVPVVDGEYTKLSEIYAFVADVQDILGDEYELTDVTPVRHGRWIFDHMTGGWSYYSHCSKCGHQEFFANDSVEKRHKYCYSCGALMDGKEDEHEAG